MPGPVAEELAALAHEPGPAHHAPAHAGALAPVRAPRVQQGTVCKNCEFCGNPSKSRKILDEYPTKLIEKSCFENVLVALSEIM